MQKIRGLYKRYAVYIAVFCPKKTQRSPSVRARARLSAPFSFSVDFRTADADASNDKKRERKRGREEGERLKARVRPFVVRVVSGGVETNQVRSMSLLSRVGPPPSLPLFALE